ncbi:hypothetical protein Ppb6_00087 [Photorhabdus australis subsp. thailandensis]|uniref:Uncharacterized protein n=1 Tax=Photorhabdus australis subsp. thailandensis TaxID=2805096 RepID=A0A1C0UA14_9GAMM|nr:hypothetical protein [Photorhabdus australis]OCQ54723.1 hypothetical protein Ppb6_00087 [Photorhabdus australis subsp. thailandensis]
MPRLNGSTLTLCLNNVGIFVADAVAPEAAVGTGVLAAGTVKVLGNTKEGAKNLAEGLSNTSKPLAAQEFPSIAKAYGFNDMIDNYAGLATKITLKDGAALYQLPGSLNGVSGRFEWIIDSKLGGVSHRMFVTSGTLNGVPSKP